MSSDTLSPLSGDLIDDAVELLERAFDEDPLFRWLLPRPERRAVMVAGIMKSHVELARPRGLFRGIASPDLRAVCLWYPPGAYPLPVFAELAVRARALAWAVRRGDSELGVIPTALRISALLDEIHPAEPFFYLQVLGVDVRHHGRGLGSSLIRACNAEADRAGSLAYLETTKPSNVRLYERYGYRVVQTTTIDSSPPIWTMRRDPSSDS